MTEYEARKVGLIPAQEHDGNSDMSCRLSNYTEGMWDGHKCNQAFYECSSGFISLVTYNTKVCPLVYAIPGYSKTLEKAHEKLEAIRLKYNEFRGKSQDGI